MSYTPKTWATGDVVAASDLNNIEQGIKNAADATVPSGGSENQFLVKNSETDFDVKWVSLSTWQGGNY